MKRITRGLSVLLCMLLLGLMSACAQEEPATEVTEASVESTEAAATETQDPVATVDEEEAWKQEPAYGQPIKYWLAEGCTSGPFVADQLGYYEAEGLTAEGVRGTSYTEALGTGTTDVAVGHIATMLVPSTNGVDLTFVGGAHIGCKSIYVLNDSEYETTDDLIGTSISVPNGIGASDYNITASLLDSDGINPLEEVNLVQVETSACVQAMQNGEISGALLSDTFAYDMVKDGTLRRVRSMLDDDWKGHPCCSIAMNATFIKENPITAAKIAESVKKAHIWMAENPEEAVDMLLEHGMYSGDKDMNIEIQNSLEYGIDDNFTEEGMRSIADAYIRLGIITAYDDVDAVMEKAWTPIVPEN